MSTYYAMTDSELNAIANAINEKTGESGTMTGSQFASKISSIGTPVETMFTQDSTIYINADIPAYAFYNNTKIKNVVCGTGCTSIGNDAFNGCTNLQTITANNVTTIGQRSFKSCSSLTTVTMNALTTITDGDNSTSGDYCQNGAFYYCTSLSSFTAPLLSYIGNQAFAFCYVLSSVTLTNVTYIGKYAFTHCQAITSVSIPATCTSMGAYTFSYCTSLVSANVQANITTLPASIFFNCTALTIVTLSNTLTTFDSDVFNGCKSLTNTDFIPLSVTTFNSATFRNCTGLTTLIIPDTITKFINSYQYDGCSNATLAVIGANVSGTFPNYGFNGCSKLNNIIFKNPSSAVSRSSYTYQSTLIMSTSDSTGHIYVPSALLSNYQSIFSTVSSKVVAYEPTLTIDSSEYDLEYGLTWSEWIESEDNTGGYIVWGNNVCTSDKTKYITSTTTGAVDPTDYIIALTYTTTDGTQVDDTDKGTIDLTYDGSTIAVTGTAVDPDTWNINDTFTVTADSAIQSYGIAATNTCTLVNSGTDMTIPTEAETANYDTSTNILWICFTVGSAYIKLHWTGSTWEYTT